MFPYWINVYSFLYYAYINTFSIVHKTASGLYE